MATAPPVTLDHLRGLMASARSVLLADADGNLAFATPESAYALITSGRRRYVCSAADLRDSGVSCRDDRTLAPGTLARAREVVTELNALAADDAMNSSDA